MTWSVSTVTWGRDRGLAAGGVVLFLLIWAVSAQGQPSFILPGPQAVVSRLITEARSGALLHAVADSLRHWVPGTIVGTVAGVSAGIGLGVAPRLEAGSRPIVRVLRPVPPLALIGFAIAWFGISHTAAAFIIAIGAFWINLYATAGGVEDVDQALIEVAESLGATGRLRQIRTVVIPGASPAIMTGVRTGVGRCWMLVVAAELFGVSGVGRQILRASTNLQVDIVMAYILVLSGLFVIVDVLLRRVERRVLRWR